MTSAQVGSPERVARRQAARNRKRWIINLTVLALIVAAGVAFWRVRRAQPGQVQGLVTARATRMNLVQVISATGSVTAQTGAMVKIGSQITGRIKRLYADVGADMRAGEIIAELDVPDLEAQVRQAEATLAVSQARLAEQSDGVRLQDTQTRTDIEKAQAGLSLSQANLRQVQESTNLQLAAAQAAVRQAKANAVNSAANLSRTQQLYDKGYVAASDVDNAKAQAEVNSAQQASAQENLNILKTKLDADLQSAKDQVKQAEATLAAAKAGTATTVIKRKQVEEAREAVRQSTAALAVSRAQLAKAFIRTPISGTVLQLTQQQGETIAAGLSAPTLIIVANLDKLQVDAFVDETDIGRVRLGQPAEVIVDAYPNQPFRGKVVKIASGATMQQNVVTYDVTIALENPGHRLKPDMTATVNIKVASRSDVLAVPVDAVKPGVQGSTVTVMSKDKEGRTAFRVAKVETGIGDGDNVEIASGLREGDVVVLSGQVPGMTTETGPRFRGPLGFGRRGGGRSSGR